MRRVLWLVIVSFSVLGVAGCNNDSSPSNIEGRLSGRLTLTGSSTVAPLAAELAKRFEQLHTDVRIDVQSGGSGKGIADARAGVADIGMASRALKEGESDLTAHQIAADGVCLIVHASNSMTEVSDRQVIAIYTDKVNNWSEVGGSDVPISVVHKAEGRATLEVFLKHFAIDNPNVKADVVVGDNEHGVKTVAGAVGAIGYVSIGTAEADAKAGVPIKLLPVGGVAATTENVASGTFPMSRPLNFVTGDSPARWRQRLLNSVSLRKCMTLSSPNTLFPFNADRWLTTLTRTCAVISAGIVFLVVAFLALESLPAIRQIGLKRFLTDPSWHPLSGLFNLVPMITGTALTTIGSMLIAVPLGVSSAVFGRFYATAGIALWHRRFVELLAGIPSVVFGLWGLVVLVPLLAPLGGSGQSLLAATLVLGLMIVPTIALTSHSALAAVPQELIAGGAALGLQRWAIARRIALPAAKAGIKTGVLLATCRAMGETMAVLMLAGNVAEMPDSIVSPIRTLTANIALEMGYATSEHRAILFVSGLVLISVVGIVVLLVDLAGGRRNA